MRWLGVLALLVLCGVAYAIDPPHTRTDWGYGDGIIPDSTTVVSDVIEIGGCAGVTWYITGYGSGDVDWYLQASVEGVYWYEHDLDSALDWSTPPTGSDTTVLQYHYTAPTAARGRPFANYIRLTIINNGADSLVTAGWGVSCNAR